MSAEWEIPEGFNFTRDVVEVLGSDPGRRALMTIDENVIERTTFAAMAREASRWSNLLRARGLKPGDRVLLVFGETTAWLAAVLGVLKAGLVVIPCSDRLAPAELAFRADDSGASLLVFDAKASSLVDRVAASTQNHIETLSTTDAAGALRDQPPDGATADTHASDTALLIYGSGRRGDLPRAAMFDHAATAAARTQARTLLQARPGDLVWCSACPGSASSIWNVLLGPWSCGSELVVHDEAFDPTNRLTLLERLGVTILCQTPEEYRAMVEDESFALTELGLLRRAVSIGGPLDPLVSERFRAVSDVTIIETYGRTEAPLLVLSTEATTARGGSIGLPAPGHNVAVIDAEGKEKPAGVEGDLAVSRGAPTIFTGYWNSVEDADDRFRGDWYRTGDRAILDEDGVLFLRGKAGNVAEALRPPAENGGSGPERVSLAAAEQTQPVSSQPVDSLDASPGSSHPDGPENRIDRSYALQAEAENALQAEAENADRVETMTSTNTSISSFRGEQSGGLRFLSALRRHWLLIVGLVAIAVGTTFVAVHSAQKRYESTADILVTPLAPDDSTYRGFNLIRATFGDSAPVVTAARILQSAEISRPAFAGLGNLASHGSVEVKPLSQVSIISIIGKATTAANAAAIANGYAQKALEARNVEFQRELNNRISRLRSQAEAIPASSRSGNFQYVSLQQAIASFTQDLGGPDPTLRLLTAAEAPLGPVYPRPVFSMAAAFFVALLLGCGIAALLEFASPRITSEDDLLLGHRLPILARIPRLRERAIRGFLSGRADLPFGAWKGYRTLRAVLDTVGVDGSYPKSVLITSASPGDGKTTTAVNLAITLAAANVRVILVDGDVHRPSVATIFNMASGRDGLARLLMKRTVPEAALVSAPAHPHLQLLLTDGNAEPNVTGDRFREMLDELARYADVIVIDAPPVTEVAEVLTMAAAAECVLVAVRLGHTQREKLAELREMLQQNRIAPTGFVVTTRERLKRANGYEYSGELHPAGASEDVTEEEVGRRGSAARTKVK